MVMEEDVFSRIIHESETDQIRLTINVFRDEEYLHLRRYFLSFEGEWLPSKDGISLPLTISNTREMFIGLAEILSLEESKEILEKHFKEIIRDLYID